MSNFLLKQIVSLCVCIRICIYQDQLSSFPTRFILIMSGSPMYLCHPQSSNDFKPSAQNTTHWGLPPRFVYCIFLEVCVYVAGRKGSWIRLFLIVLINLWVFGIDDFENLENTMDSPLRKYIHKIDMHLKMLMDPS